MDDNHKNNADTYTVVGTNIDEVKELLAKTTGGKGTTIYSDTNIEAERRKNQLSIDQF